MTPIIVNGARFAKCRGKLRSSRRHRDERLFRAEASPAVLTQWAWTAEIWNSGTTIASHAPGRSF
jgi:hypothetical protein